MRPGENLWVDIDLLMTHDVCGPGTIGIFEREFGRDTPVFDPARVILIPDHYIFTEDAMCHRNIATLRDFAARKGIVYHYDVGTDRYKGVCHLALPEEGHTRPGEMLLGTDSHTCTAGAFGEFATGIGNTDAGFVMGTGKLLLKVPPSLRFVLTGPLHTGVMAKDFILHIIGTIGVAGATYQCMEFVGEGVQAFSMEDRMTVCNMAIEAGAKNGIIAADDITRAYLKDKTFIEYTLFTSDSDAEYTAEYVFSPDDIVPCVAKPHSPDNYAPAKDVEDIRLDRAYIGSCTGGKITDFIAAAEILDGKKVAIDTYLVPATTKVAAALDTTCVNGRTLNDIFTDAGCLPVAPPSCAACLGGPKDTFGRTHGTEVVISTTNRNFPGRMGSKDASVYLASPLTVAASAVRGTITDPRTYL